MQVVHGRSAIRLLAIDIETQPGKAYFWSQWDDRIPNERVIEPVQTLCFVAKWLGNPKIEFRSTFHDGKQKMIERAWELLDDADVVIHYNGRRFDVPHLNREFLQLGLTPPAPYKQIDLLVEARKFKFSSNKLEFVAPAVGLEGKVKHEGFSLWIKCMEGDPAAWRRMKKYNVRDVTLLEDLYERLKPWIVKHPNRALYNGIAEACRVCSSKHLMRRGYDRTMVGVYQRYKCMDCGAWSRGTASVDRSQITAVTA